MKFGGIVHFYEIKQTDKLKLKGAFFSLDPVHLNGVIKSYC